MDLPVLEDFLLDPDVIFLNHGSFGACPRPVFEHYQAWQRELERQPVAFLGRAYDEHMTHARSVLADYIGCDADSLIYVPNATVGVNLVARSLSLSDGDEILTSDHEYGAMDRLWDFICKKSGARYVRQKLSTPFEDAGSIVEAFWQGVTARTKVIFLSHITSPTALLLPIEAICARARSQGILTLIDGAHAPSQIDLSMGQIGADFYVGNCHKWLCSPKSAGFLYADARHHSWLEPLIVSWGYQADADFPMLNQWQGTQDIAAYLSVPAAITYQARHHWDVVRSRCHALACYTQDAINSMTDLTPLSDDTFYKQMVAIPLPDGDAQAVKSRLYDDYRIEVPLTHHAGRDLVRVSFQTYNTPEDADALIHAISELYAL